MKIIHLTASPFFCGPDRQMMELAKTFRQAGTFCREKRNIETLFASFAESGGARSFLGITTEAGFESLMLQNDMPHLWAAVKELTRLFREKQIDIALLHGHKARMVGYWAARRNRIPCVGVSRGWTTENWRIKVYNRLDKWMLRRMDHVVCVSQGQADKVILAGTPKERITVIHNAIRTDRFRELSPPEFRQKLERLFPVTPKFLLGDAGRLSPEKGFDVLIAATAQLVKEGLPVGLVIFGEGFLREPLQKQIDALGVSDSVRLAGYTEELDQFMPHFDVFVQSSHTEGLPNVLLEAMAARTAVVATEVGGTNEVVVEGETGLMVPPNQADRLADAIRAILQNDSLRRLMGENGRKRVEEHFTFEAQAENYWELFRKLTAGRQ